MSSSNDEDALANPWASAAASPAAADDEEQQPKQQHSTASAGDDADDMESKDVWRRSSGSSDEGGDIMKPSSVLAPSKASAAASSYSPNDGYHQHHLEHDQQADKQLTTAFDEFDPFKPDSDRVVSISSHSSSDLKKSDLNVDDKTESEGNAPATPSKTASSSTRTVGSPHPYTGQNSSSNVETYQKEAKKPSAQASSNPPAQDKPSSSAATATTTTGPHPQSSNNDTSTSTTSNTPSSTTTSSGLINPLATIASAFRKRDFSSSSSKDASRTSTPTLPSFQQQQQPSSSTSTSRSSMLQPIIPPSKPAPVILIRDNDENLLIDESEKEAPPAVPSNTSSSLSYTTNTSSSSSHRQQKNRSKSSKAEAEGNNNDNDDENEKESQQEERIIGIQEEENTTFDFNFFLEQMRNKNAEPIAKYLRSFLREFSKKFWNVNDQIRVINDFLDFIAIKMRENEVWKNDSEKEFDNAVEGMEKLVMNRVFQLTFVPALDPAQQATSQTDDLERDHVLSQRIRLFQWVNEEHLDLPQHKDTASFVEFAKQELRKINLYKAPRDKLICILNCCKVIFGLMRHLNLEDGADTFIPFLILVILKSNPDHLISNVQYISRFRNPDRLTGENGYYLNSLNASISFIETMDSSSLSNIQQDEFEKNVENAIKNLPSDEDNAPHDLPTLPPSSSALSSEKQGRHATTSSSSIRGGQSIPNSPSKATQRPMNEKRVSHSTSESSLSAHQQNPPPRSQSPAEATRDFFIRSSDNLQKTVSKPLQALGKIFTEMGSESEMIAGYPGHAHAQRQQSSSGGQSSTGYASGSNRMQQPLSPHAPPPPTPRGQRPPSLRTRSTNNLASPVSPQGRSSLLPPGAQGHYSPGYIPNVPHQQQRPDQIQNRGSSYQAADFLDDSIPAEEVQATVDRNYQANFNAKIDTLVNIFSGIERETLEIVLLSNGEDVERTIEGLLDMQ